MAEDDLEVRFGATIAGAVAGIKAVSEEIKGLTAPIAEIQKAFSEAGEALIAAFAVEKLSEFVDKMGELGEQTERMSQILGESTTEVQEMGFISKITGGSTEQLARAMEILQTKLQQAQAGIGPAAKALDALGISAKSLIGLPLPEQMNKIADSISRFADGGNKIALVRELFGRMGDTLLPVLNKGSVGLEELRETAIRAGTILTGDTVKALASVHQGTVTLSAAMTALGANIVGYFSDSINYATKGLIEFAASLSALISTGHLGEAAMRELSGSIRIVGANLANTALLFADFGTFNWGKLKEDWKQGAAEMSAIAADAASDVNIIIYKAQQEMRKMLAAPETSDKPQAPATPFVNTGALAAQTEALQAQIHAADEAYRSTQEHLAAEVKLHQITYKEETKELETALSQRLAIELDLMSQEQALYARGSKEYQKVEDEKTAAIRKAAAERQKIEDKAAEEAMKSWDKAGEEIASAVASQNKALLSGTETFSQAMKNIFADLALKLIAELEKIIIKEAVLLAFEVVTGTVGSGGGFGAASSAAIYDTGTDYVPQTGLAMLHKGETVIPANQSNAGYTGGGSVVHFNVNAFDAAGVQAFFQKNGNQIANVLMTHMNQPSRQ